jgi:hypothetical protein
MKVPSLWLPCKAHSCTYFCAFGFLACYFIYWETVGPVRKTNWNESLEWIQWDENLWPLNFPPSHSTFNQSGVPVPASSSLRTPSLQPFFSPIISLISIWLKCFHILILGTQQSIPSVSSNNNLMHIHDCTLYSNIMLTWYYDTTITYRSESAIRNSTQMSASFIFSTVLKLSNHDWHQGLITFPGT